MRSVIAALLALLSHAACAASETVAVWVGYAYDLKSSDLLYTENHERVLRDGRMVTGRVVYKDSGGVVIAEKDLAFEPVSVAPAFELADQRSGYVEGMRRDGERLEAYYRAATGEPLRSKALPEDARIVADAGFDRYIEENWDAFLAGETRRIDFLVPSRLDSLRFRVARHAEGETAGRPTVTLRMQPDSAVLRAFVDPIDVVYDRETRALLEYRGLSNLKDSRGRNYTARIVFPAEERRALDAAVACSDPAVAASDFCS